MPQKSKVSDVEILLQRVHVVHILSVPGPHAWCVRIDSYRLCDLHKTRVIKLEYNRISD
jgi:hypothetical protein